MVDDKRTASITIDGETDWTLRTAEIVEAMCSPGLIVADVEKANASVVPEEMLGKWLSITVPTLLDSRPTRFSGGVITNWETVEGSSNLEHSTTYRIHASSPMALMSLRRQTRQFDAKSTLQVCEQVFDEWYPRVPVNTQGPLLVVDKEPCNITLQNVRQLNETDLDFALRLMHESGIFCVTLNEGMEASECELNLGTFSGGAKPWANDLDLRFDPTVTLTSIDHHLTRWRRAARLGPNVAVIATWHPSVADNLSPSNPQAMRVPPTSSEFEGWQFVDHPLGTPMAGAHMGELRDQLSRVRELALRQERHWRHGLTTSPAIVPGFTIDPSELPDDDEGPFLVTSTRQLVVGAALGELLDVDDPVQCSFNALPRHVPFRPPIRPERLDPPELDDGQLAQALDRHLQPEGAS